MSSRQLDELASDLDDASTTIEELESDHYTDADEKLDELHKTLQHAADTVDELNNNNE